MSEICQFWKARLECGAPRDLFDCREHMITSLPSTTIQRAVRYVSVPFALAAVLYLILVSYITLGSVPWPTASNEASHGVLSAGTWLSPVTWSSGSSFEFMANVAMFVPIGLLFRLALPRQSAMVALAAALLITVVIEIVQIPLDRVSDPRDLVANSIGAFVGAVVGALSLRAGRDAKRS